MKSSRPFGLGGTLKALRAFARSLRVSLFGAVTCFWKTLRFSDAPDFALPRTSPRAVGLTYVESLYLVGYMFCYHCFRSMIKIEI